MQEFQEINDFLPLPLRVSKIKRTLYLSQPSDLFFDAAIIEHDRELILLVRHQGEDEFDAFPLKNEEAIEFDANGARLVVFTRAGDRHALALNKESEKQRAREFADILISTDPKAAEMSTKENIMTEEKELQDESYVEGLGDEQKDSDREDIVNEEERIDPLENVAEFILTGDLSAAINNLEKIEEEQDDIDPSLTELKGILFILKEGDIDKAAFVFLEAKLYESDLDNLLAQYIAQCCEEDSKQKFLAVEIWRRQSTRHAALEYRRLCRFLDLEEDEAVDVYQQHAIAFLRQHIVRHPQEGLLKERLGLYLMTRREYQAASDIFRQLVEGEPERNRFRALLLFSLEHLKQDEDANQERKELVLNYQYQSGDGFQLIEYLSLWALQMNRVDLIHPWINDLRSELVEEQALDLIAWSLDFEEAIGLLAHSTIEITTLYALFHWDALAISHGFYEYLAKELTKKGLLLSATALYQFIDDEHPKTQELLEKIDKDIERDDLEGFVLNELETSLSPSGAELSYAHQALIAQKKGALEEAQHLMTQARNEEPDFMRYRRMMLNILRAFDDIEDEASSDNLHYISEPKTRPEHLACIDAYGAEEVSAPDFDPRLLLAVAIYSPNPEIGIIASGRLLEHNLKDREALIAHAHNLRRLGAVDELTEHITYMVSLDHDDMDTVLRARQVLFDALESRQKEETNPWVKYGLIAGGALIVILFLLKVLA